MSLENFTEMLQVAGLMSETIHRVAGLGDEGEKGFIPSRGIGFQLFWSIYP